MKKGTIAMLMALTLLMILTACSGNIEKVKEITDEEVVYDNYTNETNTTVIPPTPLPVVNGTNSTNSSNGTVVPPVYPPLTNGTNSTNNSRVTKYSEDK